MESLIFIKLFPDRDLYTSDAFLELKATSAAALRPACPRPRARVSARLASVSLFPILQNGQEPLETAPVSGITVARSPSLSEANMCLGLAATQSKISMLKSIPRGRYRHLLKWS